MAISWVREAQRRWVDWGTDCKAGLTSPDNRSDAPDTPDLDAFETTVQADLDDPDAEELVKPALQSGQGIDVTSLISSRA